MVCSLQAEIEACTSAFRSALVANNLPGSLIDQCKINSFIPLIAITCSNYTTSSRLPSEYVTRVDGACASGQCNKAGNCKEVLLETGSALAGPSSDGGLNDLYCTFFYTVVEWPKYGPQGSVDRINCYYAYPPELQLTATSVERRNFTSEGQQNHGLAKGIVIASALGVLASIIGALALLILLMRRTSSRESGGKLLGARLSLLEGVESMQWFSLSELRAATQNFSEKQLLGKGGSGKVYLGKLPSGAYVAVKDIMKVSTTGALEVRWKCSSRMHNHLVHCREQKFPHP